MFEGAVRFFHDGGPIMYPLLLCSLVGLTIVIERCIFHIRRRLKRDRNRLLEVLDLIRKGKGQEAKDRALDSKNGLLKAIGLSLPLRAFFAVVPMVYLATLLPISLGGLGVREGALVFLLARLGVPTSSAVTLSFLIYLNQVFLGMLGGSLQLARLLSSRRRVEPAESVDTVRLSNH